METFASACNDALKVGREAGTTSNVHIDVEEPPPDLDDDHAWIGVDLGIAQLATLDDGTSFSGEEVDRVRDRYNGTRASLQSKGMNGAKRVLRRLRGRERRSQKSINHRISKRIVEKAKAEGKGVRVEDLTGIREKMRVRRSGRYRHPSWAFYQLRTFLRYKCALAGVPFDTVDAAYTSRTCPECGHEEKANRKGQDQFVCQACGHEENADVVGARNIKRGGVCQPPQDESQEVASKVGVEIPA
jgi:IS605 OrfB family transposase